MGFWFHTIQATGGVLIVPGLIIMLRNRSSRRHHDTRINNQMRSRHHKGMRIATVGFVFILISEFGILWPYVG